MSLFNSIFSIVQDRCGRDRTDKHLSLDCIARETGVPTEKLDRYLVYLSEIGVISYCSNQKCIQLTEKGTRVKRIFPN